MENRNHIRVFVSSTVYNFEDVLENVYALLDGYGYDVYLSKKGTIPLDSKLSNVANCEIGVEDCDIFVGFIRPYYGSGVLEDGVSITEREFNRAFERDVPRFILCDQRVKPLARRYKNIPLRRMPLLPFHRENAPGYRCSHPTYLT